MTAISRAAPRISAVIMALTVGGVVLLPAIPAEAQVGVKAPSCGVTIEYGPWSESPLGDVKVRDVGWTYHNCSQTTVRRKVVINNHPDSGCKGIAARGYAGHSWEETVTLVAHFGAYEKTVSC
jgi:hypothetical protein